MGRPPPDTTVCKGVLDLLVPTKIAMIGKHTYYPLWRFGKGVIAATRLASIERTASTGTSTEGPLLPAIARVLCLLRSATLEPAAPPVVPGPPADAAPPKRESVRPRRCSSGGRSDPRTAARAGVGSPRALRLTSLSLGGGQSGAHSSASSSTPTDALLAGGAASLLAGVPATPVCGCVRRTTVTGASSDTETKQPERTHAHTKLSNHSQGPT